MFALLLLTYSVMRAQTMPEAIIGQTPDLPSAQTLAKGGDELDEFVAQIKQLSKRNEAGLSKQLPSEAEIATTQQKAVADAEAQAKQLTGKSIAELQNLSDAEAQAVARKAADKQLKTAGLGNLSLDGLQSLEGKSDEEIMAAMMPNTGLTPAEIKAMEGMNDAQIEAYMKQGDRMQRVQDAAKKVNANSQAPVTQNVDVEIIMQAQDGQQKFMEQSNSIVKLHEKERLDVAVKIGEVYKKHAPFVDAAFEKYSVCLDGKTPEYATKTYCEAAEKRYRSTKIARDTEAYTLWRNQIVNEQKRLKTLLADAKKVDELQAKANDEQKKLQPKNNISALQNQLTITGINTVAMVDAYLKTALDVLVLPDVESNN
jgi:hypothetical protein